MIRRDGVFRDRRPGHHRISGHSVMDALERVRDRALRNAGRNYCNFQRLEAKLKCLYAPRDVSDPIGELQREIAAAFDRASGPTVDSGTHWLETTIRIGGAEVVRKLRDDLDCIAKERNALALSMLIEFDPSSMESCERLRDELDAQSERILAPLGRLDAFATPSEQTEPGGPLPIRGGFGR